MAAVIRARAPWWIACVAALAAVYAAVFAVVGSAMFARAPDWIALGATFDLTVTATLVVWWLGVRRGAMPWWFAAPKRADRIALTIDAPGRSSPPWRPVAPGLDSPPAHEAS